VESGHRHVMRSVREHKHARSSHAFHTSLIHALHARLARFTYIRFARLHAYTLSTLHLYTLTHSHALHALHAMDSSCPLARLHTGSPCKLCQARYKARQNPSLPLERFRCSACKCFRPITDYPLRDDNFRASTCRTCHERDRDSYRERKGEPVSKEGRARRFARAQRVVERALKKRIRREEARERALKVKERGEWWEHKGQELWKEAIRKGDDPRTQG
jgi:hypothetical protein